MFSKRILSFFLLLVSFGLFAYAKPISDDAVAIRSLLKDAPTDLVERLERRGGFPHKPCHCDQDLQDVVVTLKESITVEVEEFDGKKECGPIIKKIIEKIKITITLIEKIVIHGCHVTVVINICVEIIVEIIVSICGGLQKYSKEKITVFIEELVQIHISFIETCARACPSVFELIKVSIKIKISVVVILKPFCDWLGI